MVALSLLMVVLVIAVSVVALRRMAAPVGPPTGCERIMHISGVLLLVLYTLGLGVMGVGEMSAGIAGGEAHLFPAIVAAFLTVLAWRRPDAAAPVLSVLGIAMALFFLFIVLTSWKPYQWWYTLFGFAVFGGLFLVAAALLFSATRRRRSMRGVGAG